METAGERREPGHEDEDISKDLLEFKRRLEARGISVRLPKLGGEWIEPEPLPIDANVASRYVVWLRRKGRL